MCNNEPSFKAISVSLKILSECDLIKGGGG